MFEVSVRGKDGRFGFISSPDQLEKVIKTEEVVIPIGKNLFLKYPNGYGRSKLTNNSIEKILKISATTRNWRTMNKLVELSES